MIYQTAPFPVTLSDP